MRNVIVIPEAPDESISRGAAVIRCSRGTFTYFDRSVPFGERCAQALRRGRRVQAGGGTEVGWFDDFEGEVRLQRQAEAALREWLGHPVHRNDLMARDNRDDRRHRARQMSLQGRFAEAYLIDPSLGL